MKKSVLKRGTSKLSTAKGLKKSGKMLTKGSVGLKSGSKRLKTTQVPLEEKELRKAQNEAMWEVFMKIWQEKGPYSEISGKYLGQEPLSTMFHHIYAKHGYKELRYVKDNIIQITPIEHSQVEADMHKYEEVNKRREMLKQKYDL